MGRRSREPLIDNADPVRLLTSEIAPALCWVKLNFYGNANNTILGNRAACCKRRIKQSKVHPSTNRAAVDDTLVSALLDELA
jgi:hypothetical protein